MPGFDRMFKYKSSQNAFPHPTSETLKKITSNSCRGIAHQIMTNTASTDDYGNLTREIAVLVFEMIADNMDKDENILEFIMKKSSQFKETKISFPNGEWERIEINGYEKR